jgi:hypothetical protein
MACQTARVAYHKDFWVVVGTAAPVIALAAVVALNQVPNRPPPGQPRNMPASVAALIAISALYACLILQAVSLSRALDSLAHERDQANLKSATTATISGIALLGVGGVSTAAAQEFRRIARRRAAERQSPGASLSDRNTMPDRSDPGSEEPNSMT